ncbi:MAG TPA: permease [Candidatus Omnitrophota bacterium]|nr:permease [Candidatus Omnitrophota bacterium]HSA31982.1 permease [Candidatus Omnitrophota bacterium]
MLLKFSDFVTYDLLRLIEGSHTAGMVHFFVYDTLKIIMLLFIMISLIGFLRTFLPQNKVKGWLAGKGFAANLAAAVFGAVTPFCSCSSIPIFLGFLKGGVPLGVTFSFLTTSPIINEYLVVLMLGYFGWKITLVYVLAGISVGAVVGFAIDRIKMDHLLEEDIVNSQQNGPLEELHLKGFWPRVKFGLGESTLILMKIWKWVLLGVGLGAVIHNFVPRETIQAIMDSTGFFAVPLATLIGVPMYGSCASIVPVAVVLFQKGVPLGTAMAFMMATAALSLPEAVLLRRAMKLKLIFVFFAMVTFYIILIGYLLNVLQPFLA